MGLNGNRIRELRLERGMTMEELGVACGVQKSAVNKWEKGMVTKITYDNMEKLCRALNCTPAYLYGLDELNIYNMAEQVRLSRETGIPLYKLGIKPMDIERKVQFEIRNNLASEKALDELIDYITSATESKELTDEETARLLKSYDKLSEAIDKKREKEFEGKQIIYASAGNAKSHKIESINLAMSELNETAPTNALDTDKLLELGNIIKKMDNDQLAKLIKHANLIEKGEL